VVAGARTQASLWPWSGSGFGSLPPLLVVMTVVTGIVDAVSTSRSGTCSSPT